jgi:hypothetical protein
LFGGVPDEVCGGEFAASGERISGRTPKGEDSGKFVAKERWQEKFSAK